ncbi:MAG TPA: hypothetical protein VLQ45_02735, partial [Thermoanaerobaculia bacterium]|nr:hypothetical protein [Thermoanaerobaculia bacterium]
MYVLNARRERVRLARVNTEGLVSRGARAFFRIGRQQPGPPPVAFRETTSGLLHVVYREIVIRFTPATAQKRRRDILEDRGFKVRRVNPFVPDQVVVFDPRRKHSGE